MPKVLAPFMVIAVGIVGAVTLVRSKAPVETVTPDPITPLVKTVTVGLGEVPLSVSAQGTVLPRTQTLLAAQVAAEVVGVSPHFEAGGFFERGEVLVRLDRRDYELATERAAARVAQAELRLAQQRAEAQVAADEWRQLGEGEPEPLVVRRPQLAEAEAALKAAEAELGMARLDLERTLIRAPFDGRVHDTAVDRGQYLTPGQQVAAIHAIDYAEVRLPVPDRLLAFLELPLSYHDGTATTPGPAAILSADFTGRRYRWPGQVVRAEGELDQRSRMLNLVVRVEDPYRRHPDRPPLAVGLFVDVEIAGRTVAGALLPRSALRGKGRVLVVDDELRLRYREVEVVRTAKDTVVIGGGLKEGEKVCVSPLDVVVDGMAVQVLEVEGPPALEPVGTAPAAELAAPAADPRSASNHGASSHGASSHGAPNVAARPAAGRLLEVSLSSAGEDGTVIAASIGGDFSYRASRLTAPERFVIDLIGVVKAQSRHQVELAEGPVARVRIGQFQTVPEPITRLVFDLRSIAGATDPAIERASETLTVTWDGPRGGI